MDLNKKMNVMEYVKKYLWFGIAGIVILWSIFSYNGLIEKDQEVKKQWAQVQTVYQRRADLIPNFVETVKGAVGAEKDILSAVMNARASATKVNIDPSKMTSDQLKNFQGAQDGLSSALGRLMVVVEKYPDLKSIQGFSDLRTELEGTENRIAVQRMSFNDVVKEYNSAIAKFPKNLIARLGGFLEKPYFESAQGSDIAPSVKF